MIASFALMAWAAGAGSIRGRVLDAEGRAVVGADVTVTDVATGAAMHATSGAQGEYSVSNLRRAQYRVRVQKSGFSAFSKKVTLQDGQPFVLDAKLAVSAVKQSITVSATAMTGATPKPTQEQVASSDESIRVLDKAQIDSVGPVAGGAQIISLAPGTDVKGYGNTGSTKYTVTLNGIQQGWGNYGGYSTSGAVAITMDGIPVSDPATNLWQSNTIPQSKMIQNTNVTYGPGSPEERSFNNVGGGIEFTPLQPKGKLRGDLSLNIGSYAQKNAAFDLSTPTWNGWSAVVAGGVGSGESYRVGPDGFKNKNHNYALYGKTIKDFNAGSVEFGGYYAHSGGFRPQVIPTQANSGITVDGQPGSTVYSQQTSGFYSTLPYDSYNKYDTNTLGVVYARATVNLNPTMTLTNSSWYTHFRRLHSRLNDVYSEGPQLREWNNPHTNSEGDKLTLTKTLRFNKIAVGGYYIHTIYNSRNNFFNPADGGATNIANIGGKIRSSYFNMDDAAIFAQDQIRFSRYFSVTPGVRFVSYQTGYSNAIYQDFGFATGATPKMQCPINLTTVPGNVKVQSASCDAHEQRNAVEPSVEAQLTPTHWLTVYGGYSELQRTPQVGGGGGLFQSVDPTSYHLSKAAYSQAGFKVHFAQVGSARNLLAGFAFYRLDYSNQELDYGLANGDTISANGASLYKGVNAFFDVDPVRAMHVFFNMNGETSKYTKYITNCPTYPNLTGCTGYNNLPVPYVPTSTVNLGASYDFHHQDAVVFTPRIWYQYTGTQHIFDNNAGAPSNQTMAGYGVVNLGFKAPIFKHLGLDVELLNVADKKYNEFEYVSSGGYFGTPTGGYDLAYPAAPFTVYGGITFHL